MNRRTFIKTFGLSGAGAIAAPHMLFGSVLQEEKRAPRAKTAGEEIRIVPGQWRPYFSFEQIAWVQSPWSNPLFPDFIWLDFPEAIFCRAGLLFLSHVNPGIPALFSDLPRVPWEGMDRGIRFERILPNGVKFGGSVSSKDRYAVQLALFLENRGPEPLQTIRLQVCAYLRAAAEFSARSMANKFVHVPGKGWLPFDTAVRSQASSRFRLGWRSGPAVADLPVIAVTSSSKNRVLAMTWYDSTHSLVGNPMHPCMHADPAFPDLEPGQSAKIQGELIFFDGVLQDFSDWFEKRYAEHRKGK